MLRLLFFLACIGISWEVVGASFDCDKARSKVEKLICDNEKLSSLDEGLDSAYKDALSKSDKEEKRRLVSGQRNWLRNTRNACRDEACLERVYGQRIGEIDPFADKQITCEEMRKHPKAIFGGQIDLGSGSGSPIDVDYRCKESLASLPFLKRLAELTETIRAEGGPQVCTGSIIHAHWRYHQFTLTGAGFAPRIILRSVGAEDDTRELRYFEQWSWESPYNYLMHGEFFSEFNKALPKLADHYRNKFGFSNDESRNIARKALMIYVGRAAGASPRDSLKEPSTLARLARDDKSTESDLRAALASLSGESTLRRQAYQALKVALLHDRPQSHISLLVGAIGTIEDEKLNDGDESAIFFALPKNKHVQLLLDKGAAVDFANSFGKTSLFYAIGFNDRKLVGTLLGRRADPNHAYKTAKELNPDGSPCSANTYLKHTKRTPLMHAAQNSDVDMLKLLIKHGARLNDVDELGFTALDYAVMGHNSENQAFLAAQRVQLGAPTYPLNAAGQTVPERALAPSTNMPIDGFVSRLAISPRRPDILVASVQPWDQLIPGANHGLHLFSISKPGQPRPLAHFPRLRPYDFALSQDGKTAYVMHTWFQGAPKDREYGLLVIDISQPENPRLAALISGDFMTMHLSRDGKYLYLQERNLTSLSRGILVYSAAAGIPKLLCSNPFGKTKYDRSPFAYSFATFPDEQLLAIRDQVGGIYLYDVADPCNAKLLSPMLLGDEQIGTRMTGYAKRSIFIDEGGLMTYKLSDPPEKQSSWVGSFRGLYINERLGSMVAIFGQEVALLKIRPDGRFSPTDRYRFESPIGDAILSDSGTLYVGFKGGLSSARITIP